MDIKNLIDSLTSKEKSNKIITIVGARKTPVEIIHQCQNDIGQLNKENYIFRSGNAQGFDQVIANVPEKCREVYLPYHNFGCSLNNYRNVFVPKRDFDNWGRAVNIVKELHPNKNLTDMQMMYLARDVYQVLGKDLQTPSDLVICWTEDGASELHQLTRKTGGTAMALRVAFRYNIPVININSKSC